ncbi:hypothetical protein A2G06_06405 [Geobacter anodireducens]|nr:hypothetical protein A2G06_06405 [Geobacter anodireducens]
MLRMARPVHGPGCRGCVFFGENEGCPGVSEGLIRNSPIVLSTGLCTIVRYVMGGVDFRSGCRRPRPTRWSLDSVASGRHEL